ncbi:MAG TPA: hypothetical protein VFU40_12430 [Gemmatimonadales bacterium]|nr:hypothetical protein [Gemmatimonadales bacterium]
MGCLAAPFKLVGVIGLVAALAIGWLYRDRLGAELERVLKRSGRAEDGAGTGRPGTNALVSANAKIDSLNGWGADSVVLTASEVASLIGAGLDAPLRRQLDSLRVELGDGEVAVSARLATARLPRELIGPLAVALREREPIEAGGPLHVVGPRRAEWEVRTFSIRDIPLPRDAVPKLVGRAFGDTTRRSVPVRIPAGVREIRVRPAGATLFGSQRP